MVFFAVGCVYTTETPRGLCCATTTTTTVVRPAGPFAPFRMPRRVRGPRRTRPTHCPPPHGSGATTIPVAAAAAAAVFANWLASPAGGRTIFSRRRAGVRAARAFTPARSRAAPPPCSVKYSQCTRSTAGDRTIRARVYHRRYGRIFRHVRVYYHTTVNRVVFIIIFLVVFFSFFKSVRYRYERDCCYFNDLRGETENRAVATSCCSRAPGARVWGERVMNRQKPDIR